LPDGWAFSHCVKHAWVVQLLVLRQSMMSPHAALFVHAAPSAQHFEAWHVSHAAMPDWRLPQLLPLEPLVPLEPLEPLLEPPLVRHVRSA
jgi:hypothetical protein